MNKKATFLIIILAIILVLSVVIVSEKTDFFSPVFKEKVLKTNTEPVTEQPAATETKDDVITIKDIKDGQVKIDDIVEISGTVTSKNIYEKHNDVFLNVKGETGEILVVIFGNSEVDTDFITKGKAYSFKGRVDYYKEQYEVVVDKRENIKELE